MSNYNALLRQANARRSNTIARRSNTMMRTASDSSTSSLAPWPTEEISLFAKPAALKCNNELKEQHQQCYKQLQVARSNNERNLNNAPDKENNYNWTRSNINNAPDKQRFKQGQQLQFNNETHDLSCAASAIINLAADTIFFFSFAHMCCDTVQPCSCMNEPATKLASE